MNILGCLECQGLPWKLTLLPIWVLKDQKLTLEEIPSRGSHGEKTLVRMKHIKRGPGQGEEEVQLIRMYGIEIVLTICGGLWCLQQNRQTGRGKSRRKATPEEAEEETECSRILGLWSRTFSRSSLASELSLSSLVCTSRLYWRWWICSLDVSKEVFPQRRWG